MSNEAAKDFGRTLKELREYRGLSQNRLSTSVGLSGGVVSKLESGDRLPSREMVAKIAKGLFLKPGDNRYIQLMNSAGFHEAKSEFSDSPIRFHCMELHLLNEMFPKMDGKTQVDVRLSLRLIADAAQHRGERQ